MPFKQLKGFIKSKILEIKYNLIIQKRFKQLPIIQEIDRIRESKRYQNPKSLIPFGDKVYSQSDEDGIIREIFNRIGVTNQVFVEFGIGNGLENNSLALLFDGWQGLWKGYCLVGCNISGVNAFFVRKDLISDQFLEPFTAENHYEPPRYYLSGYFAGHPATYQTLAKSLTMR